MWFDTGLIGKIVRFSAVGALGAVVDFGFTYLFKDILKVNKFVSNAIGFSLSATLCFFLNKFWTYQSSSPLAWKEYLTFIAVSLVGLGINSLILYLLTEKAKMHFYLSKCFAILVAAIWNFLANLLITFV
ncbi:MAG: GtrA family protein [Bacteroidales bacterium]|nr:GtrA family protein [Bacteroidales bacterium]